MNVFNIDSVGNIEIHMCEVPDTRNIAVYKSLANLCGALLGKSQNSNIDIVVFDKKKEDVPEKVIRQSDADNKILTKIF